MAFRTLKAAGFLALCVLCATPAYAQFGIGARMSMVRSDDESGEDRERFTGAHIRAHLSPRTGVELALDRRIETNLAGTERVRQYPLQASLLLFLARSTFAPYLLGGGGWYRQRVDVLENDRVVSSASTRNFGWHGGFGAELRLGRHAALHGDYRYTRLRFGDEDEADAGDESAISRLLPSHGGSMWTAGLTIYF